MALVIVLYTCPKCKAQSSDRGEQGTPFEHFAERKCSRCGTQMTKRVTGQAMSKKAQ